MSFKETDNMLKTWTVNYKKGKITFLTGNNTFLIELCFAVHASRRHPGQQMLYFPAKQLYCGNWTERTKIIFCNFHFRRKGDMRTSTKMYWDEMNKAVFIFSFQNCVLVTLHQNMMWICRTSWCIISTKLFQKCLYWLMFILLTKWNML